MLVYSMVHVCLNLIEDYSHVLQNFLSDGLMMPFEKIFFLLFLNRLSNERMERKIMFVAVANGILSSSFTFSFANEI